MSELLRKRCDADVYLCPLCILGNAERLLLTDAVLSRISDATASEAAVTIEHAAAYLCETLTINYPNWEETK